MHPCNPLPKTHSSVGNMMPVWDKYRSPAPEYPNRTHTPREQNTTDSGACQESPAPIRLSIRPAGLLTLVAAARRERSVAQISSENTVGGACKSFHGGHHVTLPSRNKVGTTQMQPGNAEDDRVECQSRLRVCECAELLAELYMGLATDPAEYRAPLRGGDVHTATCWLIVATCWCFAIHRIQRRAAMLSRCSVNVGCLLVRVGFALPATVISLQA